MLSFKCNTSGGINENLLLFSSFLTRIICFHHDCDASSMSRNNPSNAFGEIASARDAAIDAPSTINNMELDTSLLVPSARKQEQ